MAVTVLCVGKLRKRFYSEAVDEYRKRLGRLMPVSLVEVPDGREPENAAPALCARVAHGEGERILRQIGARDYVIALCADAKQATSEELADKLNTLLMEGKRHIVFVVGGSLGLSPTVLARANERVSMSRMTFPHQLARVMLMEQLYRAAKINAGERYHK